MPAALRMDNIPLLTGTWVGRVWEGRSGSGGSQEDLRPLTFLPLIFCVVSLITKSCQAVFHRNILIM